MRATGLVKQSIKSIVNELSCRKKHWHKAIHHHALLPATQDRICRDIGWLSYCDTRMGDIFGAMIRETGRQLDRQDVGNQKQIRYRICYHFVTEETVPSLKKKASLPSLCCWRTYLSPAAEDLYFRTFSTFDASHRAHSHHSVTTGWDFLDTSCPEEDKSVLKTKLKSTLSLQADSFSVAVWDTEKSPENLCDSVSLEFSHFRIQSPWSLLSSTICEHQSIGKGLHWESTTCSAHHVPPPIAFHHLLPQEESRRGHFGVPWFMYLMRTNHSNWSISIKRR